MSRILILFTLLTISYTALADTVVFQPRTVSLVSEDGKFRLTNVQGQEEWSVTTPSSTTDIVPKVVSDDRPVDGCLTLSFGASLTFEECAHDGPTSLQLNYGKTSIPLRLEVKGRFFPSPARQ